MSFWLSLTSVCLVMNLLLPSALFPGRIQPSGPENRPLTAEEKRGGLGAAVLLELLADVTMSAEDFLDAEVLYRRTRDLYRVCGDCKCLARCSTKLAIVLAEENKFSASKIESEAALKYYSQLSSLEKDKGAVLHNLGWIAAQQGDIDEACARYLEAIRHYSLFKNDNLAAVLGALSERSLARLYFQQKKYGMATEYYRECLTTLERKLKRHHSMTVEVRREYTEALLRSKDSQ